MFNRDQEETPARGKMTQLQLGKGLQEVVMCGWNNASGAWCIINVKISGEVLSLE